MSFELYLIVLIKTEHGFKDTIIVSVATNY